MRIELSLHEARVIGCLIEKEITSPDQYPLSLNAVTSACNQKSNRHPLLSLDEVDVRGVLDELIKQHLVVERTGFGSRVPKYAHRFCNTDFGDLKFSERELGIVCELLLRGPQTPGELRTRTSRLCAFSDSGEVESVLAGLESREDGPFVIKLAREPGRREPRYAHLFSGEVEVGEEPERPVRRPHRDDDRIARLEEQIDGVRRELEALKEALGVS